MVIGRLSALTHQVLGQFKMACLLLGSYVVLGADLNRQQLGGAIRELLPKRGDAPTWVSTAGGGVAWLHVRLDSAPKYYTHRPYTRFAGGGARSLRAAAFAGSGGRQDEGAWRKGTSLR